MQSMTPEQAAPLEIASSRLGKLELDQLDVPYVNLEDARSVYTRLKVGDVEYTYSQSCPIQGHSAVLPGVITQLQAEGHQILVAERGERYYLYLTSP